MTLGVRGDQRGERGLAGAGRAVKDHARQAVGFEHSAEQFALAEEMLLADELIEGAWSHADGERCDALEVLAADLAKKFHGHAVEHRRTAGVVTALEASK